MQIRLKCSSVILLDLFVPSFFLPGSEELSLYGRSAYDKEEKEYLWDALAPLAFFFFYIFSGILYNKPHERYIISNLKRRKVRLDVN